jgi:hypothetical protein
MSAALISLAMQAGAPLVRDILTKRIGAKNAALAGEVMGLIAGRAGVDVADLSGAAKDRPDSVMEAIVDVEVTDVPGLLAIYAEDIEFAHAALEADLNGASWKSAWRPAGMYMLGFLWVWNVVLLHVLNAAFKIALPPMPFEHLFQLTAIYTGLYMGGHTVKDLATKVSSSLATKWGAQ